MVFFLSKKTPLGGTGVKGIDLAGLAQPRSEMDLEDVAAQPFLTFSDPQRWVHFWRAFTYAETNKIMNMPLIDLIAFDFKFGLVSHLVYLRRPD